MNFVGLAIVISSFLFESEAANCPPPSASRSQCCLGMLRLRGKVGRIDLVVVYANTGAVAEARGDLRLRISRALAPQHVALTVLAGDWNYTALAEDRFTANPLTWTGAAQVEEESHFQQLG